MTFSKKTINEIAQDLDMGMAVYINRDTKEFKTIIDPDNCEVEDEYWEDDLAEIEKNWKNYFKMERMSSSESFRIMEDFAEEVTDEKVRARLLYALNQRKPFRNFKFEVDNNGELRQQWFDYKEARNDAWVKAYLDSEFLDDEEEEEGPPIPLSGGYYNDDGTKLNPNLISIPNLCMSCKKKEDPSEEIFCNLNRLDQAGESDFKCAAYEQK